MEELEILFKATLGNAHCSATQMIGGGWLISIYTFADESADFKTKGDDLSDVAKRAYEKALSLGLTNDV